MDVGSGVGVVEKMWMCGCRQWGGCCGENVDVGCGVGVVEKMWMLAVGGGRCFGENVDVGSGRGWVLWRKCGCWQWERVGVVEKMWM